MIETRDINNIVTHEKSKAIGTPPGVLYVPPDTVHPVIDITLYNADSYDRRRLNDLAELKSLKREGQILWVDVNGLGDPEIINEIGNIFGFHKLSVEDVVHLAQRPKIEEYDDYLFFVTQYPVFNDIAEFEQISIFLGKDYVVTFQATEKNWLESIVKRLEKKVGRIRSSGADYLAYAVADLTIDAYFPLLERFDETVEDLEEEIATNPNSASIQKIYGMKRQLLAIRKATWGMREGLSNLTRNPHQLIQEDIVFYLRDTYDHCIRVIEMAETYRELASGLMDWYQSCLSQRMNETMKTLTIMATIFIPLTFIAGIYGMNFNSDASKWNMPELNWAYGYPLVWGVMLLVALAMLWGFVRKGWIGNR